MNFKFLYVLLLFLAMLVPTTGRTATDGESACVGKDKIGFIPPKKPRATSVIVFVHGVLSNSHDAWTYSPLFGKDVFWPCLVHAEKFAEKSDVFVYSYHTTALTGSPSIREVAKQLTGDLRSEGIFAYGHVVFLAHSMGGLVVSRMLLDSPELATRVKLILFYGTPGWPSEIAKVASNFSGNAQFNELGDAGQLRKELIENWSQSKLRDISFCTAESPKWYRPTIVSQESAGVLCGGKAELLYGLDHAGMVKPDSVSERPHRFLVDRYSQCILPLMPSAVTVETVRSPNGRNASTWFAKFKEDLLKVGDFDGKFQVVKVRMDPNEPEVIMPEDESQQKFLAGNYKSVAKDFIGQQIAGRLWAEFREAEVESIVPVDKLNEVLHNGELQLFSDRFVARLMPGDLAVMLRAKPGQQQRLALLVGFGATLKPSESPSLKGYLFLPAVRLSCS